MVQGRCKSTNQCDYCAKLAAVENTELLTLDALHGIAPVIYVCLTTRSTAPEPRHFYKSRELILRDLRARWPTAEVAWLLEFTTGYGERSGGLRRPHWNGLLKGIPVEDVDQVADVVRARWCGREDALPAYQEISPIRDVGGLTTYIAAHFQKCSQAPPPGWRGHRFTKSRGYLWRPTPEARELARRSLRERRELNRLLNHGLDAREAFAVLADALAVADATTWRLMALEPSQLRRAEREQARARLAAWVHDHNDERTPHAPPAPPVSPRPLCPPEQSPHGPAGGDPARSPHRGRPAPHASPGRPTDPAAARVMGPEPVAAPEAPADGRTDGPAPGEAQGRTAGRPPGSPRPEPAPAPPSSSPGAVGASYDGRTTTADAHDDSPPRLTSETPRPAEVQS
jgi:hypothetical protein